MAVYMATLANGGTRVTPHLLKAVDEGDGMEAGAGAGAAVDGRRSIPQKLQAIRDGLWMVVNGGGTGGRARIAGLRRVRQDRDGAGDLESGARRGASGRTRDLRDNGWFVFFAPRDNPQIAGVVFAEHGDARAQRRADREARHRDVFCEEGRAVRCRRRSTARSTLRRRHRRIRCATASAIDAADRSRSGVTRS